MIEMGEYIRTKKGEIMKVTSIPVKQEDDDIVTYQTDKGWAELESDIVKHSKNIVDLIEIEDYVNGEKVVDIFDIYLNEENEELASKRVLTKYRKAQYTGLDLQYYLYEEDIKSVLTHEQYEQNCYRLEE